jgi:hypothetical protein
VLVECITESIWALSRLFVWPRWGRSQVSPNTASNNQIRLQSHVFRAQEKTKPTGVALPEESLKSILQRGAGAYSIDLGSLASFVAGQVSLPQQANL